MGTPEVVIRLSRSGRRSCDWRTVVSSHCCRSTFRRSNVVLSNSVPCWTFSCLYVSDDFCSSMVNGSSSLRFLSSSRRVRSTRCASIVSECLRGHMGEKLINLRNGMFNYIILLLVMEYCTIVNYLPVERGGFYAVTYVGRFTAEGRSEPTCPTSCITTSWHAVLSDPTIDRVTVCLSVSPTQCWGE